jgi:hypothetical protein
MDNNNKDKGLDQQKPEELKKAGNDAGSHKYEDPSGTDPERYESAGADEEDTLPKPKNHTTPDERMINPDRGE